MVTEEEYLKAKAIVEEWEDQEYRQATIDSMHCVECQAFDEHDCFCDDNPNNECDLCGETNGNHHPKCAYADPLDYMNCGYE